MNAFTAALADGAVVAERNLIKIKRLPDLLVFTTVQPVMFVLLFAYVFGGAIDVPGVDYREFLMAGIFVQTVAFGSTITGTGLADDLQKGIIDRFRSLPMSRAAVLVGRTTSDLVNNLIVVVVMSACGLLVGWRIREDVLSAAAGFALLLLFSYALSWISATIGLAVRSVEVVNNASFLWVFPLTFLSNAFVPLEGYAPWLRPVAEWNPVTAVIAAVRDFFGNVPPPGTPGLPPPSDAWPLQHPVIASLGWIALILAVFVPLAIRQYRRAATR